MPSPPKAYDKLRLLIHHRQYLYWHRYRQTDEHICNATSAINIWVSLVRGQSCHQIWRVQPTTATIFQNFKNHCRILIRFDACIGQERLQTCPKAPLGQPRMSQVSAGSSSFAGGELSIESTLDCLAQSRASDPVVHDTSVPHPCMRPTLQSHQLHPLPGSPSAPNLVLLEHQWPFLRLGAHECLCLFLLGSAILNWR